MRFYPVFIPLFALPDTRGIFSRVFFILKMSAINFKTDALLQQVSAFVIIQVYAVYAFKLLPILILHIPAVLYIWISLAHYIAVAYTGAKGAE